jgi:hypothetical protein
VTALVKVAAALVALVFSCRALAAIAAARVPILPGWVVPVPAALLAIAALLALIVAGRVALALLAGRGVLPYVAVAVTWREIGR